MRARAALNSAFQLKDDCIAFRWNGAAHVFSCDQQKLFRLNTAAEDALDGAQSHAGPDAICAALRLGARARPSVSSAVKAMLREGIIRPRPAYRPPAVQVRRLGEALAEAEVARAVIARPPDPGRMP